MQRKDAWEQALGIVDNDGKPLESSIYFDGFKIRVFSSFYADWGLEILRVAGTFEEYTCESVFYSPSCLSGDSYGGGPREGLDYDDAMAQLAAGDDTAFVPWGYDEWRDALRRDAWDLLDAYCVE